MATKRTTRSASQNHLSSDYDWQTLPEITAEEFPDYEASLRKHKSGKSQHQTPQRQPSPTRTGSATDTTSVELAKLQLLKETNELEVKKLELQLQLASIQHHPNTADHPLTSVDASTKSLGDMKAPQRTLFPQPWPHIYAPGEPKLYSELSLAEFCAGYAVILQNCQSTSDRERFLHHFHVLTTLACSFKWSAVRAFHAKVLRSIELGLIKWGDSFEHLKQPFFIPTALLDDSRLKIRHTTSRPTNAFTSSVSIPRHQICDDWSWHATCDNPDCPKQHICVVCKRPDHRALSCPKRKFPVPPRRQDPSPRD